MKTYIGIDPGATGAMAVLLGDGRVEIYDREEIFEGENMVFSFLSQALSPDWETFAAIEKAQAMPKQGTVSMFNYGVNYGRWLQSLDDVGIPYQEIPPANWKKEFSLIHQDKQRSIEVAKNLFPSLSDKLTKKKDHGRAEALLIAEYARRKNM